MAITLSTLPLIYPVYNNNLILNASHTGATSNHYFKFDVYIGTGLTDSFNYPCSPLTFDATINLSTILSTYFTTSVYQPTTITMFEDVPDSVVDYHVHVSLYSSGGTYVTSAATGTYYTFNGCVNMEESFDMQDFMFTSGNSANFLTNWHTERGITIDDYAYLQTIIGQYGTDYNSDFKGLRIIRHQLDGTAATILKPYSGNTTKCILNMDISPKSINVYDAGFIDSNTEYYTVQEISGSSITPMQITIIKENKLRKFYNFQYVNRLGGLDFFTAVKVSDDKYKIKKEQLEQFVTKKTYYIDSDRTTTVLTQFLSAYQAMKLQEMFSSNAIKLWFNGKINDITIVNSSITVLDRYPKDKFIQMEIEFKYNYKNFVQQF